MDSFSDQILRKIKSHRRGWVFAPKDFLCICSRGAVGNILSRLTKRGVIRNIAKGIYDYPKQHKLIGKLSPNKDHVAKTMAAKYGDIIYPSGAMAANLLGLSTQVPVNNVYTTNGHTRHKQIGDGNITLKHARVSLIDNAPFAVNLTLQALSYLGRDGIDDDIISRCASKLSSSDIRSLNKVVSRVPAWMVDVIHQIQDISNG